MVYAENDLINTENVKGNCYHPFTEVVKKIDILLKELNLKNTEEKFAVAIETCKPYQIF